MSAPTTHKVLETLWCSYNLPTSSLSRVILTGNPDTSINSSFRLGLAAQVSVALSGLSAARLYAIRTGKDIEQGVHVDARHAALAFNSSTWYDIDGKAPEGELWDKIAGIYKTKDNGFVRVHTNFPHHRRGILSILGIPNSPDLARETVAEAMLRWNAIEFETEASKRAMCATALRSFKEWDSHPHAQALAGVPPVIIRKIGEAPKRKMKSNPTRPLDGIRVLDLSRVLAGPVAGRTLAAHGADVLLVTSPNLPSLPYLDAETSLGKRTTQLDLTKESDRTQLSELVRDCDVFMQAYRPGGLKEKGFGDEDLVELRPGIVNAHLTAWGWEGPWKDRKGFDSLVQTATGFNYEEGKAYQEYLASHPELGIEPSFSPKSFPMQTLDHAAGYFLAFGINTALSRTITEGGSWGVYVSLAAVGQWLRSLGRVSPEEAFGNPSSRFPSRKDDEITRLSVAWPAPDGRSVTALKHPVLLYETPVREGELGIAPIELDAHDAKWL